MINYEEKLKELRFNFRPEETIDYQTLITLVASLFTDPEQYEKNKEELFHTLQILVLVYGLDDQLNSTTFRFDPNNINIHDLNLWKFLLVTVYNDLEKTNDFTISDNVKQVILLILNKLDKEIPQQVNPTPFEQLNQNNFNFMPQQNSFDQSDFSPEDNISKNERDTTPYEFVEPTFNFMDNNTNKDEVLTELNYDYLPTYILHYKLLPQRCACCGLEEWQGKPIKLILSRINGGNNRQTLDNLQFLCPNCYSQIGR